MKNKIGAAAAFLTGLFAVLVCALVYARQTGADFFAHCLTDSYTLQALAWRAGKTTIDGNLPWLELAIYEGKQYLCFPPVPTLPLLVLSFFFGENTPSGMLTLLYLLGGYAAGYFLCARRMRPGQAAVLAALFCVGGSLTDVAVSDANFCGAVWYQAQMLAFLLTMLAFLLMDGKSRRGWYGGLACFALAIGCRPTNIAAAPVLLWLLWEHLAPEKGAKRLVKMIPFCIAPFVIGCAYGFYNLARFDSFFEFGHSHLPEFTQSGEPMLQANRIFSNLPLLLRMPTLEGATLRMPAVSGFAVLLTQPWVLPCAAWLLWRALRRELRMPVALAVVGLLAQAAFVLMHRTFGGWQYGTRYLCDLLPMALYLRLRLSRKLPAAESAFYGGAAALNLLLGMAFHGM